MADQTNESNVEQSSAGNGGATLLEQLQAALAERDQYKENGRGRWQIWTTFESAFIARWTMSESIKLFPC